MDNSNEVTDSQTRETFKKQIVSFLLFLLFGFIWFFISNFLSIIVTYIIFKIPLNKTVGPESFIIYVFASSFFPYIFLGGLVIIPLFYFVFRKKRIINHKNELRKSNKFITTLYWLFVFVWVCLFSLTWWRLCLFFIGRYNLVTLNYFVLPVIFISVLVIVPILVAKLINKNNKGDQEKNVIAEKQKFTIRDLFWPTKK
ncbi:MAG: hypothetical protein NTW06_04735 [Candidatus Falkowbacteria bacterium]|nr:hypothetical protein [Candidatus Falkowbacteria bacterium]